MDNYRNLTPTEVEEVLYASGMNPDDYKDWTDTGMILKSEDDSYIDIWDKWSSQSNKYNSAEIESKWQSFNGTGLTMGTLVKQAKANGWRYKNNEPVQELDWDSEIDDGNEPPVYSGNPVENRKIKARLALKKAEPAHTLTNTPEQHTESNNNNITFTEDDKRFIKALKADSGTYSGLIDRGLKNMDSDSIGIKYYQDRAISKETREHYHAGWIENYKGFLTGAIIPGSYDGFAIRNINFEKQKTNYDQLTEEEKKKSSKPIKYYKPPKKDGSIDIPVGLKQVIQEPDLRDSDTGYKIPIFITEGYFDVMSIYEATGINGISLNGIGNFSRIIKALKYFKVDRPIYLALDNDETGKDINEKRYKYLKKAGFTVYWNKEFYGKYKDANEYLQKDPDGFKTALNTAKLHFVKEFEGLFNRNKKEQFKQFVRDSIKNPPIPTGFDILDSEEYLDGGLYPGSLYIMGAISSLGKTSFILQIADNIATLGIPVLYISLEMPGHELRARSISRYTYENAIDREMSTRNAKTTRGILDGRRYSDYYDEEKELIKDSLEDYFDETGDSLIIYESKGKITVRKIKKLVNQLIEYKKRPPVVFIDYLQLLGTPENLKNNSNDKMIIDENLTQLKQLARDYNLPVFSISSFNRDSYGSTVGFKSFKESGLIEYSSDVLIGLEPKVVITDPSFNDRTEKEQKQIYKTAKEYAIKRAKEDKIKEVELKILKNRNGQANNKITYTFRGLFNHYQELDKKDYAKLQAEIRDKLEQWEKEKEEKQKEQDKKNKVVRK